MLRFPLADPEIRIKGVTRDPCACKTPNLDEFREFVDKRVTREVDKIICYQLLKAYKRLIREPQ